jgi:hypothetical protein
MSNEIIDADRRWDTALSLRQVIATYAVYWHKLAVDSTIFIVTGCIAFTGFAISRESIGIRAIIALSFLIFLLGWFGAWLCHLIRRKTEEHQLILVKLDRINKLIEPGAFIKGDTLYPGNWAETASGKQRDPIFLFCFWLLACLPLLLTAVLVLTAR